MVGIGALSEGAYFNTITLDFLFEMAWQPKLPKYKEQIYDFVESRYFRGGWGLKICHIFDLKYKLLKIS